ncbi:MAG: hypothetical protein DI551_05560 [Micavibrio aeruginosavorus]|uniref:FAS1 domain-containing protein n=1 Tax=Micavibrio aeruginosavorus TaxID=349221 RepID=A0A2W5MYE4_9BACT|nr:MAG: hypothetical protein DI551_05560 [Micavibrio aeruginosavorus]
MNPLGLGSLSMRKGYKMKVHLLLAASAASLLLASPASALADIQPQARTQVPATQVQAPAVPATPAATAPKPVAPPAPQASAEPVSLQPTPLPANVAKMPNPPVAPVSVSTSYAAPASLGDSGTMYAKQMALAGKMPVAGDDAARVAAIAPAAGTPTAAAINAGKPAKMVAGVQMLPSQTIAANISGAKTFSTLLNVATATGVQSASFATPLPITLFAPDDAAFRKLPKNAFNILMTPANRAKLTKLMNYHIVPGVHDAASIRADIAAGRGTATYQTLAGDSLRITAGRNGVLTIIDDNGNRSRLTTTDAYQSNGVVHVVDTVIIPK